MFCYRDRERNKTKKENQKLEQITIHLKSDPPSQFHVHLCVFYLFSESQCPPCFQGIFVCDGYWTKVKVKATNPLTGPSYPTFAN